jgi:enediyne biosynthesis protein E4
LRGTGYPDIVIANDFGVSEYFANDKGKFREIGRETGVGYAPKSGMNASLGDVLNTGRPAIYVSNITEPNKLNQRNNLWVPVEGSKARYQNLADAFGVGDGGWSFGAQFGDFNNDGAQDLYCTNGYVSGDRQQNYWYDYSKITGANSVLIKDAKNWPPMHGRSLSGYQSKRLWVNDGAGTFREVAQSVGVTDKFDGRAVAVADLWNRGALDLIVANQKGPLLIYKNNVAPGHQWIQFALKGTRSNKGAIGAQVTLFWNGKKQTQFITGGEGFCAQNMRRLHFGLGKDAKPEKAVIRWPSGALQTVAKLKANQIHEVIEASEGAEKTA